VVATAAVMDAEAQGDRYFDLDKQQAQKAACKYTTKEVEEQQAAALRQIDGVDKREVPPQHDPTLGASSQRWGQVQTCGRTLIVNDQSWGTRQALYADEGLSQLIHRYDLAKLFQAQ